MSEKTPPPRKSPDATGDNFQDIHKLHSDGLQAGEPWAGGFDSNVIDLEVSFVHMLKSLVWDGYVATMGAQAFAVLTVIKCHAEFVTGEAFPSRARICELTGLNIKTVDTAIKKLSVMGLLKKEKVEGRRSMTYTVVEPMPIHKDGEVLAVAEKNYSPQEFRDVAGLKQAIIQALQTGVVSGAGANGLTVNINVTHQHYSVKQGDNSVFNAVGNQTLIQAGKTKDERTRKRGKVNSAW